MSGLDDFASPSWRLLHMKIEYHLSNIRYATTRFLFPQHQCLYTLGLLDLIS